MADGSVIIDTTLDSSGVNTGSKDVEQRITGLVSVINRIGSGLKHSFSSIFQSIVASSRQSTAGISETAERATQAQASASAEAAKSVSAYDKQLAALEAQIDKQKAKLSDYFAELQRIHQFTDEALQYAATDADAGNVLDTEQVQIDALNQKYAEQLEALERLEAEYQDLAMAREAALQADTGESGNTEGQAAAGGIQDVGNAEDNATPKTTRFAGVLAALARQMLVVANHALTLGKRLARIGFNAVSKGIKKGMNNLKSFAAQTKKTSFATNSLVRSLTSLKRLLITRIKRMFISSIFNNVREGLTALQKYSAQFNAVMTSLKNSAKQVAGNISVALGSLVTTVAPVLQYLLNLLNTILTVINQVFAALGGRRTYTVAKNASGSYSGVASNASNAAGAVSNATDAQKKFNEQLYSYDELNQQNKKNNAASQANDYAKAVSNAADEQKKFNAELYGYDELTRQSKQNESGGGGGGGGGAEIGFEEQPIDLPQAVMDWIERLKEAWQSGDWYGVGKVVAEGLNAAMEVVDNWINNKFRPIAVEWAGRIAEILNGFIAGLNWKLLGKTIADGINAVFDAAYTFLSKVNWLLLGRHIGEAVKSWFDNIDWKLIGKTFAQKWNALIQTIRGFVTTPGMWESIGKSIGTFVKNWFAKIDINSVAGALIGILNGVTASIRAFFDENPFEGLAEKIYNAINRVLHEVDWAGLGAALSDLFKAVLDTMKDVVANIDWHQVGVAIGEFLGSIDWAGIFAELAEIIWTAFSGMLEGLLSTNGGRIFVALLAALKLLPLVFTLTHGLWKAAIMRWIVTGISPLQSLPTLISQIAPNLSKALAGLVKVVSTGALAVVDALLIIYDVKTIGNAAKTYQQALDAHEKEINTALKSYAKLYKEKGKECADAWAKMVYDIDTSGMTLEQAQQALTDKIGSLWEGVPQDIFQGFAAGWRTYFGAGGSGLLGLVRDAFTGLINGVKSILGIASPSTVFMQIGADLVMGLFNGISQTWNLITEFFTNAITSVITFVTEAWTFLTTATATAWNTIKTDVTTAFTMAKDTVLQAATNIRTKLTEVWNNAKALTTSVWNFIKSHISSTFTAAKNKVVSVANALKSNLKAAWNAIKAAVTAAWNSIKSTTVSTWTSLSNTVSSKWQSLRTTIANVEWASIGRNLVEGLKNGVGGAWDSLVAKVQSLCSSLIARIKSWFGVASPSKVFAEIGGYLDAGLEQGIMDGEGKLLRTAGNLAEAVTNGMTPNTPNAPNVEMTAEGVVTSMQAVQSSLSSTQVVLIDLS